MVTSSAKLAKLIVPHHMPAAQNAIALFKDIRNPKIKSEVELLKKAWSNLKDLSEAPDQNLSSTTQDRLSKKISK